MGLAELPFELPARIHRLFEELARDGLQLHLRADEFEPMVARTERAQSWVATSVLAAAVINGLLQLAAAERARSQNRRVLVLSALLACAGMYAAGRITR